MIRALADFLEEQGYSGICIDVMPDAEKQLDTIYLGKWSHTVSEINDGTGVQFVQIQVRRTTYDEAYSLCDELFKLLDSGLDEAVIHLNPEHWCIARPRRGPIIMERASNYTTFYYELALWGEN